MKKIFGFLIISISFSLSAFAQLPSYGWTVDIGSAGNEFGRGVCNDAAGNVINVGYFTGTVDFDPGAGVTNLVSNGNSDVYLAKYTPAGALIWAFNIGGASVEYGYRVKTDASDNIYIVGVCSGTVDFDPGAGIANVNGPIFIAKYDASGNYLAAIGIASSGGTPSDLCIDGSGNVVVTGSCQGSADWDPGAGVVTLPVYGLSDIFLAKYTSNLSYVWAGVTGSSSGEAAYGVTTDSGGNMYIVGAYSATTDFDFTAGTANRTVVGNTDGFMAKYSPTGAFIYCFGYGSSTYDYIQAIRCDANDNIYIAAVVTNPVFVNGNSGAPFYTLGGNSGDVIVAKYTAAGMYQWAATLATSGSDFAYDLFVDGVGDVYITGAASFYGYVSKFSPYGYPYGTQLWTGYASVGTCVGYGITVDNSGGIYYTGTFTSTIDFDLGPATQYVTSAGSNDGFLAKLSDCTIVPVQPGTISGPSPTCQGASVTYSISPVAGASSYTWILPVGWTGSSTSTSITTSPNATSGTVTVIANNGCGASALQNLAVTVTPIPLQPFFVSGLSAVCQTSTNTYSIPAVVAATSYTWTLPAGWTGTSTTNSINATASATSGNVSVTANNSCGISPVRTYSVTVSPTPTTPGTISGSTSVCSGSNYTYSITAIAGATSYTWTLPGGWTGSSTTNSISVTAGGTGGTISVTANNGCGSSGVRTLAVTLNSAPVTPGTISGNTAVCAGSSNTYSITAVAGATSYTWTLPGGWTGTSSTISITATAGSAGGNITVVANNSCGTSASQTFAVTVNPLPATPGTISGNSIICSGSSNTYSIAAVPGATSYSWTMPVGWTGTSTTTSITATASATSGTISVTANNGCGASTPQTLAVTVNPLPTVSATASNPSICAGSSSTLTGSGANTYAWNPGSLSGTSVSVTPTSTTTYTVTGTNTTTGCSNTANVSVTVNPLPTVSATASNPTICSGNSSTLTGSGANTYAWNPGSLSGTSVSVSPVSTTTYTVIGTNSTTGCSNTANVSVTVNPLPTVSATASNPTICSGNSSTLTGSGANTYAWNPGSLSGTSVSVTPASTTTYTVTGTNSTTGCSNTANVSVTVNPLPIVSATASIPTICAGSSSTLTGSGANTYAWNPGSLSGTSVSVSPVSTTTYTVIGTNSTTGCSNTANVSVTVNPLPTVSASASNPTICSGNSSTLTGSGANTYAWNPGSLSGTSVSVTPASTTTYTVTGTNSTTGCSNTANVSVTVNPLPTVSATASNPTICSGNSSTLTGSGANTYAWNPGSLSGTSVSVTPTSTTTYTVTGTNSTTGCSNTANVSVTVNSLPTVSATASNPTICAGSSSTLTGSGANTYAWNPGSLSGTSVLVSPASTTTYTVTGTNTTTGCSNTANVSVTVNPLPTVSATASNPTICSGNSSTLTGSGAITYTWMPGSLSGTSVTDSPTNNTTYTVTGTDINGCTNTANVLVVVNALPAVSATASNPTICTGNSTTLTGSGASTYAWMPGSLSGTSVTDSPTNNTTYTVTGTDMNGCTNTANVLVVVNALPAVSATASNPTICTGNSTTLTGSGASTYAWMPGSLSGTSVTDSPTTTTTYTVTGTDVNGCTNTANVLVAVNALPTVSATASNPTICAGSSTTLTGNGANTYTWNPGSFTGTSFTDSPATTTTYTVTGTDVNGCTNTANVLVAVNALPTVSATASNPTICAGSSTTLTGNGANTYTWNPGSFTGTSFTDSPATTTTYIVTGTDMNGCANTGTIMIIVNPLPVVSYVESQTTTCINWNPVTLSAGSPVGGTYSGPGVTGNQFDPFTAGQGTWNIVYAYTDTNGCSASSAQQITVDLCLGISNPVAFSDVEVFPNPFSNTITVQCGDASVNGEIKIYNMLGEEIFSSVITDRKTEINLEKFPSGIYLVRILSKEGIATRQIIKQ